MKAAFYWEIIVFVKYPFIGLFTSKPSLDWLSCKRQRFPVVEQDDCLTMASSKKRPRLTFSAEEVADLCSKKSQKIKVSVKVIQVGS